MTKDALSHIPGDLIAYAESKQLAPPNEVSKANQKVTTTTRGTLIRAQPKVRTGSISARVEWTPQAGDLAAVAVPTNSKKEVAKEEGGSSMRQDTAEKTGAS